VILDSSAVCAVIFDEPLAGPVLATVEAARKLAISAATTVELAAVMMRSSGVEHARRVEKLLAQWDTEVVPFDADQARIAADAYRLFGRGSGHRAALNFGDCFAYALAIARDEPLLFVGDDFQHTDVRVALR